MQRQLMIAWGVVSGLVGGTAHAAPAWCSAYKAPYGNHGTVEPSRSKDWKVALPAILNATCTPDDDAKKHAAEVDGARAAWSKQLGLAETDWPDVIDLVDSRFFLDPKHININPTVDGFLGLGPIEQFLVTVGVYANYRYANSSYSADALGSKLTATGRFGYVWRCTEEVDEPVMLAGCAEDIKQIDRGKVISEIRADKAPGKHKMVLRILLSQLDDRLAQYVTAVDKWKKTDPAYAKMFDIAAKTRADWDQFAGGHQALLDLTLAMDDAREVKSRKALEGCSAKTWAAWKEAVTAIPATSFVGLAKDMTDWAGPAVSVVLSTPQGYLAGVALYRCLKDDADSDGLVGTIGGVLAYEPGLRGPRLAAYQAILLADLKLDKLGETVVLPRVEQTSRFFQGNSSGASMVGTISKLGKPDGSGDVELTFATKTEKEERCLSSKLTNRIANWNRDGSPNYYYQCLKYGVVAIDKTPEPTKIKARYVEGLKPGMNVYFGTNTVYVAFPKGKKTPLIVTGAAVK